MLSFSCWRWPISDLLFFRDLIAQPPGYGPTGNWDAWGSMNASAGGLSINWGGRGGHCGHPLFQQVVQLGMCLYLRWAQKGSLTAYLP